MPRSVYHEFTPVVRSSHVVDSCGRCHVAPAAHPANGYVDHALAVLLDPYARDAGLVPTGPFNLGAPEDYRVPDHGYHRSLPQDVWVPTAAIVVEMVSPDDETYAKFDFYGAHGVEEMIVADPQLQSVRCFGVDGAVTSKRQRVISWA